MDPSISKNSICLNMIVKDEAEVIEKCLSSVKPLIDYWVIVDTGSSDNTRAIIKDLMAEIPGELHERPWVDFAQNRNEALELARNKGDYVLLIDADEVLQYPTDFALPALDKDLYFFVVRQVGNAEAKRYGLINNHLKWRWQGVLHEFITCPEAKSSDVLHGVINVYNSHRSGLSGRSKDSDRVKYLRDADTLEKALKDDPNNSRYAYYLGISYAAAGELDLARHAFENRSAMANANAEETYSALYNLGLVQLRSADVNAAQQTFWRAHTLRPTRAEPLLQLAKIYREDKNLLLGYLLAKHALTLPYPDDDFCVEYVVYDYTLLIEFANCALLLGKFDEGLDACSTLLANPNLPPEFKGQVESNFELARRNLGATPESLTSKSHARPAESGAEATSGGADLGQYVRAFPGAIDDALVADLIALPGAVKMDEDYRRCSLTPVVGDVLERFRAVVRDCFADYRAEAPKTLNFCTLLEEPNVLRYEPSTARPEQFHEHSDAWDVSSATRVVSVIAYLNDVARGGETVFTSFDRSQRCEKGTILFFPSSYLYHHLARPPESGPKIVVVTWLHFGNGGVPAYRTTPLG